MKTAFDVWTRAGFVTKAKPGPDSNGLMKDYRFIATCEPYYPGHVVQLDEVDAERFAAFIEPVESDVTPDVVRVADVRPTTVQAPKRKTRRK